MTATPGTRFDEDFQVPPELAERDHWVCWRYEERGGNRTKVPIDARTGRYASPTDPSTWTSLQRAIEAWKSRDVSGVGFMFAPDDDIMGVDLDDCIDPQGNLAPAAAEIISSLYSYAETSPSGRGVKIFLRGRKPPGVGSRSKAVDGFREVEIYDRARFFCVTGHHWTGTPTTVEPRQEELNDLCAKLWPPKPATGPTPTNLPPIGFDDDQLLAKARAAKNGDLFDRLWAGDTSAYKGDDSAADLALCNVLAFWWGGDTQRMDAVFRRSGLFREKWDERHGARTYGEMTIAKSLEGRTEYFGQSFSGGGVRQEARVDQHGQPSASLALTDIGNGERFVRQFGDRVRYVHELESWIAWDGRRWVEDIGQTQECAKAAAQSLVGAGHPELERAFGAESVGRWARSSCAATKVRSAMEMARSTPGMTVRATDLDAQRGLLNVQNGVIDLEAGRLLPHDPSRLLTRIAEAPFDPSAECPLWEKFIHRIFGGDLELIEFVQRAAGYSLSGEASEGALFINYGGGANGKTTFIETLSHVLGDYAKATPASTLLLAKGSDRGPRDDVAALLGARLVSASETGQGRRLDESLVKSLTGGDTVTARPLYGKYFSFRPTFVVWMSTNHKPEVEGTDEGIWRRIRLIPFNVRIPEAERDPQLKERLKAEAPGILAWCLRGHRVWQEVGLSPPPCVMAATEGYRDEQDDVAQFIEECCDVAPGLSTGATELHRAFVAWADTSGARSRSLSAFGSALNQRGFESGKHPATRRTIRCGLALRSGGH